MSALNISSPPTPSGFCAEIEHIAILPGVNPGAVLIGAADKEAYIRQIAMVGRAADRPSSLEGTAWLGINVAE